MTMPNLLMVLPICDKEIIQAYHLAQWLHMLGGMTERRVLLVHTWKAAWDINPIIAKLRETFGQVDLFQPPLEDESGWPVSSNTMFQQVAEYLNDSENVDPWFWHEVDVCPLQPNYWAALEHEYEAAGLPYMGSINESRFQTVRDGVVIDGEPRPAGYQFLRGRHMVGAGIYPADFWRSCKGIRTLSDLAFDVQLGPEIEQQCHDTPLICHRWQTKNYRREQGVITMDDVDPEENHYGGRPIPPEAIVVHGAKDTSLIDLLAREHLLSRRNAVS
jgi:hypothetical protein